MTIFARIGKVVLARAGGGGTTPPVTREAVEMTDTCEPLNASYLKYIRFLAFRTCQNIAWEIGLNV